MISDAKTDRAVSSDNGEAQTHRQGLEWRQRPLVGTRREAIWWYKSQQLFFQGACFLKELPHL